MGDSEGEDDKAPVLTFFPSVWGERQATGDRGWGLVWVLGRTRHFHVMSCGGRGGRKDQASPVQWGNHEGHVGEAGLDFTGNWEALLFLKGKCLAPLLDGKRLELGDNRKYFYPLPLVHSRCLVNIS